MAGKAGNFSLEMKMPGISALRRNSNQLFLVDGEMLAILVLRRKCAAFLFCGGNAGHLCFGWEMLAIFDREMQAVCVLIQRFSSDAQTC